MIETVVGATRDLQRVVEEDFRASFADDKSTHVGTDLQLANRLALELVGDVKDKVASTVVEHLGCDYHA